MLAAITIIITTKQRLVQSALGAQTRHGWHPGKIRGVIRV